MNLQIINLIIYGIGILMTTVLVRNELCCLVDSIQDKDFKRIKRHITSAVFWFSLLIFDIAMFSLWLFSGSLGG